jgi:hypothetical protein
MNQMLRLAPCVLACGLMLACRGERPREVGSLSGSDVLVEHNSGLQETDYSAAAGDCRISWTVYGSEANRGVIRHRSDCGLTLSEQAPLIAKVLRKVMETKAEAAHLRTLSWGRLYPDGARDATIAVRLALAAKRSAEWDAASGTPRGGDINGWVRGLANEEPIYRELRPLFQEFGLEIRVATVEKVLVQRAELLPFFETLRQGGAQAGDRLPFDCQVWFSVRPAGEAKAGGQARP